MQLPTKQFWTVLFSLVVLRLIVGCHFFSEGISKIRSGSFSCAAFLGNAKGPFADRFLGLLDDHDGRLRLCIDDDDKIDTERTYAVWDDFVQSAKQQLNFDEQQQRAANSVLAESKAYLSNYLAQLEPEIIAWIGGEERLTGFQRDGDLRVKTASRVESLNDQVDSIKRDRNQVAKAWLAEIELTWDELEARINRIGGKSPEDQMVLTRPFALPWSKQQIIDRMLPWFDVTVGVLLVIGLFSRLASLAGIGLLLGVVATQPFWILGAANTYYQWIEIAALGVLFATAAGRFGGLDYFLNQGGASSERAPESELRHG